MEAKAIKFKPKDLLGTGEKLQAALDAIYADLTELNDFCGSGNCRYCDQVRAYVSSMADQVIAASHICNYFRARAIDGLDLENSVLKYKTDNETPTGDSDEGAKIPELHLYDENGEEIPQNEIIDRLRKATADIPLDSMLDIDAMTDWNEPSRA